MNRAKPATVRRPSAAAKPSGHPPPGDFIALGSKGQANESKTASTLLKPAPSGLPSERKRDAAAALAGASALTGLTKRPKLSSTPPLSALGRLAEAAVAEKRAISPSIKEPSVVPIEVPPSVLLDEIEAAELEGNDGRIEGVLCGAVKQLKATRAKPDSALYLSLMYLAKIKPNIFATEGVIEALCSLLRRDASINFKAKGNSLVSVLACSLLMAAYEEDENWPEIFVKGPLARLVSRELLSAHRDNLGTTIKFVVFNELSNARNPNNMQILYTVLQHSSELAPKFLAMVFQDLLTNKDDYLRASRALLREIVKQTKHEVNFQAFCLGLMQERKEAPYLEMEFKERFVVHITDVLAVSMMLGITAQVKEAGVAWDKGEKKSLECRPWILRVGFGCPGDVAPRVALLPRGLGAFPRKPLPHPGSQAFPVCSPKNFQVLARNARVCDRPEPMAVWCQGRVRLPALSRGRPAVPAPFLEKTVRSPIEGLVALVGDRVTTDVWALPRVQAVCVSARVSDTLSSFPYQPPNLAISTLYWKAWPLLLVVAAFNPENIGLAAWEEYPTLKMLMEMVMTNNYSYPPCTLTDEETRTEMINRELQTSQREKQEILAFEGHLAAASTKQTITENSSLLLSQLTSLDPQGPPRRPPPHILDQVKGLNQSLRLGHLLCRSRSPDFLLNIIQRQASSQSMPWLADLVQSSEGSLDVLPVQCLCEFLLHDAADDATSGEEEEEGESKEQKARKRQRQQKQRQLLGRLQDLLLGPKADEQTTCEVLDYFLRRLGSPQVASRVLAMKGLSLVLSEGSLRDGEEKEPPMEEDSGDTETLQGYQWLLRDLPRLPLFDSVRTSTALALQQAIHMETDPQTISAYLVYLSQHTPVEEQGQHSDLALDVARLVVERSTIMSHLFSKRSCSAESDAVLVALLSIFSRYVRRMRKSKEGEEVYSWSESQDQVFLRWTGGETATMHILVVHAMVILLTLGPPRGVSPAELGVALPNRHAARHVVSPEAGDGEFQALLDIWFPEKQPLPTAFLVDTSEEALLLPDWLKLRMIRSEVPRLVDAALQDLEPQQLLLFVQSFGIPVSSMSKLLQYLDQAVAHDPQTLEQNIMDKNYMAHLVEVQHERGASGGQTFHSLLTASLPPRRDGAEAPKPKSSPEQPSGQGRTRAVTQVRVLGPEDDLAGTVLQFSQLLPSDSGKPCSF
ncbi:integrator complex subunit 1-like [Lynx pardinus]|uniref:Integrator complex subunit 1-like n=1 Tax=Lynx pardinus TaxID=191816 RepID=A0A485NKH0_LYNPA|nr:integrator complex subunit 1-like [Lynx pardinus]